MVSKGRLSSDREDERGSQSLTRPWVTWGQGLDQALTYIWRKINSDGAALVQPIDEKPLDYANELSRNSLPRLSMSLSGKSVLVTGAEGFIGSHLVERLVVAGANVTCLVQYNADNSLGWLADLETSSRRAITHRFGDVRDAHQMIDITRGKDLVFHLAALISIPHSYEAPLSYAATNILGTANILEACRINAVPKLVLTSTSEVYGTPDETPIVESHPLQAQSPYAASKVAADQLGMSYAASYGMDVAILRPFNTYGPRQSLRAIIPTILAQMLSGQDKLMLGSLHPKRDFTFVTDTADGFIRIAEAPTEPGDIVQLGSGDCVSIGELVEICRKLTGSNLQVVQQDTRVRPSSSEVQVLLADPSKARRVIGWSKTTSLESGLAKTADWLRERATSIDVGRYHV